MIHKQTFAVKPRSKQRPQEVPGRVILTHPKETREYEKLISEALYGCCIS
jgi:hypothetical protein